MSEKTIKELNNYIEKLEEAFVDGHHAHDLVGHTGYDIERCEEIRKIFDEIIEKGT